MTRQWLLLPLFMCKQHMLGEHLEAHIFVDKMRKGYKLDGFIRGSMFFGAEYIKTRHDLLAELMPNHKTPLDLEGIDLQKYPRLDISREDMVKSLSDLLGRCSRCRELSSEWLGVSRMVNKSEDGI